VTASIVIPARYGSSRFPGKPLALIHGRPLIWHTWCAAVRTRLPVWIATDDERIRDAMQPLGAAVVMTGGANNGTERVALAARELGLKGPVINWQGDSPLVPPEWPHGLLEALGEGFGVATPVQRCSADQAARLKRDMLAGIAGATTAVIDGRFRALYFSKTPVPTRGPWWFHIGLYAYSQDALEAYGREEGVLERSEQLEQLRFLERGVAIAAVPVDGPPIWEVNHPDDIRVVEGMMSNATVRT
jgi:3-deoxy-manno-octulosonate cytidylyltransferase (CMP-KDO synthetase)